MGSWFHLATCQLLVMSSEMLTDFIQNFRALEVRDGIGSAEFVTQWCGLTVARVLGGSSIASRRLGEWVKHDESIKLHIKSTNAASVAEANVQWIVKLAVLIPWSGFRCRNL